MQGILYSQITRTENLLSAWNKVKTKGSTGGIDNISIEIFEKDLEANIKELSNLLSSYRYIPEPYKEIRIPKDEAEFRSLSLPTIRDKIVQEATKDVIEPILEREFLNVSYAYRADKGPAKAISRVSHLIINEKRQWVTLCDIDSYFDSIPHNLLFELLPKWIKDDKIIDLIRVWVRMGRVDHKLRWKETIRGIPQEGIISPLLSNLYLHPFDQMMVERKFGYVRYADDFVILSYSEPQAYRALRDATWFLEKRLMLKLNSGACVKKIEEGFEFLGILFEGDEKTITEKKQNELKERICQAIEIENLEKLNETVRGISIYYGRFVPQEILEELDEWMIDHLKVCLKRDYQEGVFEGKDQIRELLVNALFLSGKYSVFECLLSKSDIEKMKKRIKKEVKKKEDIILYYHLCHNCYEKIERIGENFEEKTVVKTI